METNLHLDRMSRREFLRLAALLGTSFAASSVLAGCRGLGIETSEGVFPEAAAPRRGGTLVVGLAADSIVTLDPAAHLDRVTETVVRNIFDGLVTRTTDDQIVLELVETYHWTDSKTVEFNLRQDVKFHNGDRFTADDVVFTFERILTQDVGARRRSLVEQVGSVEKMDDYTVRFDLKRPWPAFPRMLGRNQIVPQDYVTRVGDEEFARYPVGTGPFRFVEGTLDGQIVLERFDDYYGGAEELPPPELPFLDRVIFRMMPESSARADALCSGEVHIIQNVPASVAPQLVANPDVKVKTAPDAQPHIAPREIEAASVRVHNWQPSFDGRMNLHAVWLSGQR
jgi:peptide/nickel transport system substrate-binding protein